MEIIVWEEACLPPLSAGFLNLPLSLLFVLWKWLVELLYAGTVFPPAAAALFFDSPFFRFLVLVNRALPRC